jgi:hypothetical protein
VCVSRPHRRERHLHAQGNDDTKYGYVTPYLLYERLTGDTQYRPIAKPDLRLVEPGNGRKDVNLEHGLLDLSGSMALLALRRPVSWY